MSYLQQLILTWLGLQLFRLRHRLVECLTSHVEILLSRNRGVNSSKKRVSYVVFNEGTLVKNTRWVKIGR